MKFLDQARTAPVVRPLDAGDVPPQRTLSKAQQVAYTPLAEVVLDQGTDPPECGYIPDTVEVVDFDAWRQHAYKPSISTSDQPRAKQIAFQRASADLINFRKVATYDDLVWLADAA